MVGRTRRVVSLADDRRRVHWLLGLLVSASVVGLQMVVLKTLPFVAALGACTVGPRWTPAAPPVDGTLGVVLDTRGAHVGACELPVALVRADGATAVLVLARRVSVAFFADGGRERATVPATRTSTSTPGYNYVAHVSFRTPGGWTAVVTADGERVRVPFEVKP